MTTASGVGSLPGEDQAALDEGLRVTFGELPGLPFVPEVPGRGVIAAMIGRTLGLVTELGIDLQPAGWRLTDAAGVDHRRARSLLSQDLDRVEEVCQGWEGPVKTQVCGPWTLAALVEKPRGDKVLADVGARRDLAEATALGVAEHVRDLRRRLPSASRIVVQIDEPALPAVLAGRVPTASGFNRHRTVDLPQASAALELWVEAVRGEGAEPWIHCCAADAPLTLLRGAGAVGLSLDLALAGAEAHDTLAEALEAGETLALGVLPAIGPPAGEPRSVEQYAAQVTERVQRWLGMLGLDIAEVGEQVVLTATCGQAGATADWVRTSMRALHESARQLS